MKTRFLYSDKTAGRLLILKWPYLQHRVLLEAKAVLEQTSDVGHVHAQKRKERWGLGRLTAHYSGRKEV